MQKILPPILLLLCFAFIATVDILLPVAHLIPWPFNLVGILIIVFGIALAVYGSRLFHSLKTNIYTFAKPDKLITTGIFAYSRNPIYLGLAIAAFGAALWAASLTPWAIAIVFCIILDRWYVRFEENMMLQTFGDDYMAYQAKVRRWI
jgi:protein-S-isoprenylcysteine O-methyltransferase Ste14